jgi:hypothetical protein
MAKQESLPNSFLFCSFLFFLPYFLRSLDWCPSYFLILLVSFSFPFEFLCFLTHWIAYWATFEIKSIYLVCRWMQIDGF